MTGDFTFSQTVFFLGLEIYAMIANRQPVAAFCLASLKHISQPVHRRHYRSFKLQHCKGSLELYSVLCADGLSHVHELHYLCLLRFTKGTFEFCWIGPFSETCLCLPVLYTFDSVRIFDAGILIVISLTECINFIFGILLTLELNH